MNADIIILGELNVDLLASGLDTGPVLGKEILATDFRMVLGSASAIFACGAARLGHSVTFFGKVGLDDFGRFCIHALQQANISTKNILQSSDCATGVTIVLSTPQDRAMVTCLGAIAELRYSELPRPVFSGHRHLHLTSYFLQHGLRPDFMAVVRDAKREGLTVSFDPNSDPTQAWEQDIWEIFAEVDVVFLNELEALAVTHQPDMESAARYLQKSTRCAVIKLGSKGALGIQGSTTIYVAGFTVDAVDTTGAGDSFAAGFVHGMLQSLPLQQCLSLGNAAGALSTRGLGGTSQQPDVAEINNFIVKNIPTNR